MKFEEFSPLFICANCAYILRIAAEKLNFENFNDVVQYTGSTFEKIVGHERCRIKSSSHWRKLRIYIAYSSGVIKL